MWGQINMAEIIITLKIMPESPEIDWEELKLKSKKIIEDANGEVGKEYLEDIAFGIKALFLIFIRDESLGSADNIADEISNIDGISSAEITDIRRAIG